ncbi:extracellular solute-binding protein [Microbacterium foliorum]
MITVGRGRRILKLAGAATAAVTVLAVAGCAAGDSGTDGGDGGDVTIEFAQWWEPELPDGEFRALIDEFEDANPGITVELVSGPYASTKEQLFAGAASGTMPDVVGLDGAWVNDFASQGVIADLTALMEENDYDDSELASQIQVDGSTYMIPVVNFVYPMFTNDTLLADAGVTAPPTTRSEFADAASKVSALGGDVSGWVLPLSLEAPNGVQNDVMSWVWALAARCSRTASPI